MCKYNLAWIGDCKEPEVENGMCEKHKDLKCRSCGKPATHECAETGQFVCGAELCDDCEHTICDNGTNGGIGLFREGKRPEGFKEHCKKSEQVYKPWYVTETEKIDEGRASEEAMRELKPVVDLSEHLPNIDKCQVAPDNQELADKIRAIQIHRDTLQAQVNRETLDMTTLERIRAAIVLVKFDGILEGLDIALKILREEYNS